MPKTKTKAKAGDPSKEAKQTASRFAAAYEKLYDSNAGRIRYLSFVGASRIAVLTSSVAEAKRMADDLIHLADTIFNGNIELPAILSDRDRDTAHAFMVEGTMKMFNEAQKERWRKERN